MSGQQTEKISTPADFPEDFKLENGCYNNICCNCGRRFLGHKRRFTCKCCDNKQTEKRFTIIKEFSVFKIIDKEKKFNDLFSHSEKYIVQNICDKFNAVNDEQ